MWRAVIAHAGITVADLDRAVEWYRDVLGFDPLGPPGVVREGDGHGGTVAADVFGAGFGSFRQVHLAGAGGTALELFEFERPVGDWRAGLFHVCAVTPDIEAAVERVAARGGRVRSDVWAIFEGEPYRTCYCEDPFGTVIELYSHSHERTWANR